MKKIYRLVIQELYVDSEYDGLELNDYINRYSKSFSNLEQGHFSSIEKISEIIPKCIENTIDNPDLILNIYAEAELVDEIEPWKGNAMSDSDIFVFFNKDGSVIPKFDYRTSIPKYNKGDIVSYARSGNDYDVELEIGIISHLPEDEDNVYIMLIGTTLHDHQHPHEGFLRKFKCNDEYLVRDLKVRLELGY